MIKEKMKTENPEDSHVPLPTSSSGPTTLNLGPADSTAGTSQQTPTSTPAASSTMSNSGKDQSGGNSSTASVPKSSDATVTSNVSDDEQKINMASFFSHRGSKI